MLYTDFISKDGPYIWYCPLTNELILAKLKGKIAYLTIEEYKLGSLIYIGEL